MPPRKTVKKGRETKKCTADTNVAKINFGFESNFSSLFELGNELGGGHSGYCYLAKMKKGRGGNEKSIPKGVAVKIIPKTKITSSTSRDSLLREINFLRGLSGSEHIVQFNETYEDDKNVYIVMELCEGGQLCPRISTRNVEHEAKYIIIKLLQATSFLHLQGVVHRDLKPENVLLTTKAAKSTLKIVDFGLSYFVTTDQKLQDIVGTRSYISPEMLTNSYNVETDLWSIGVITYLLLSGRHPFLGRSDENLFKSISVQHPSFTDPPWPSRSPEAINFVRLLLTKNPKKRMSASQSLSKFSWLQGENVAVPLDILIYKLVRSYLRATPLKQAAHKALSKALTKDELIYIHAQFDLLEPKKGRVSLDNFKKALMKRATPVMKEARVSDILVKMKSLPEMSLEEFTAATVCPHQLEALQRWETIAQTAFDHFKLEGNCAISVDELPTTGNTNGRS